MRSSSAPPDPGTHRMSITVTARPCVFTLPDGLQTVGSTARNLGLMVIRHAVLFTRRRTAA